ncbi:MAG: M28 family peptidase [Bacteroidales bacterium]
MKQFVCLMFGFFFCVSIYAQDLEYARAQIDTLASEAMHGRGYVNRGDRIAADYLEEQLQKHGLEKVEGSYRQHYSFPVNTFPGTMKMIAGDKLMRPGYDFQVKAYSKGLKDTLKTIELKQAHLQSADKLRELQQRDLEGYLMVIDPEEFREEFREEIPSIVYVNFFGASGYIVLQNREKLIWGVSGSENPAGHPVLEVLASQWNNAQQVILDIENEYINQYRTSNVYGYVPGTEHPDSFVLVVAHYDHLGRMGKNTCYCGAHDNASGTGMTLDLARYFAGSENRPAHSLMFVFFSGEEAGLHGSSYFAEHPPVELDKIKFVLNLDLIGSGSKGIGVVNGKVFKPQFELLKQINEKNQYIADTKKRGESSNSDHYPFHKNGVSSFFFYTMGDEYQEYHTPEDRSDGLPLTAYEGLFRLIRDYVREI